MEKMATWEIALRRLEMPVSRFLLVYVGGAAFAGFVVALIAIFLTGGFSGGALFAGFAGVFCFSSCLLWLDWPLPLFQF